MIQTYEMYVHMININKCSNIVKEHLAYFVLDQHEYMQMKGYLIVVIAA